MKIHETLDRLIHLEERVGHLYIQFYKRFAHLPGVADLWWEMALEEHEHAGILKMVKALTGLRRTAVETCGVGSGRFRR